MLHPSTLRAVALRPVLGLDLVGPYHILAGRLKGVPWQKCVLHSRHFYDPPEFLTVISGEESTGFHIGYFRCVGVGSVGFLGWKRKFVFCFTSDTHKAISVDPIAGLR